MRKFLIISTLSLLFLNSFAQKVDTLYYDSNWKGVPVKTFATYMTITYMSKDSKFGNLEKSFYITGELQGEFNPVYIDKYDGKNSRFKGNFTTYYKSGKKEFEGFYNDSSKIHGVHTGYYESGSKKIETHYKNGIPEGEMKSFYENGKVKNITIFSNGIPNGEHLEYYESGNIEAKGSYINGKIEGTLFQFFDEANSNSIEIEIQNNVPKHEYITYVDKSGNRTKYDKEFKNLIQDTPTSADRKSTIKNGNQFLYYQMNGLFIAVNITISNKFGKYYIG